MALPGGDDFGPRPVDMHLRGLAELGAQAEVVHGYIEASAAELLGGRVVLEFPSVGATENLLMAAVAAKGTTVIDNAAREPEISDLCEFLSGMGAGISGAGSSTLAVEGAGTTQFLSAADHTVVPDRIVAATYLAALGVASGEVLVAGARYDHMELLCQKLTEMGMLITPDDGGIRAIAPPDAASTRWTAPRCPIREWPPTTSRSWWRCWPLRRGWGSSPRTCSRAGSATWTNCGAWAPTSAPTPITRWCGASSACRGRRSGAHDIRAGAALAVAGLGADGPTVVTDAHHVARGYEDLAGDPGLARRRRPGQIGREDPPVTHRRRLGPAPA